MSDSIKSPLTGRPAKKVSQLSITELVDAYRAAHRIEVASYLPDQAALDLYECNETGLRFYVGDRDLAGPPEFYARLYSGEGGSWGYQETKWEFEQIAAIIGEGETLLDVGCGGGDFLSLVKDKASKVLGLETSEYGRQSCAEKDVEAVSQTILDHAPGHGEAYDVVTAFQVLEHVSDPHGFIQGCVDVLRPGGRLVLSVPNNESFLQHCGLLPLNAPPHHLTLWSRRTLQSLETLFPLELRRIEKEPLQDSNLAWYKSAMETKYLPPSRIVRSLYYRLGGDKAVMRYLRDQRETIDGHTILAIYVKK